MKKIKAIYIYFAALLILFEVIGAYIGWLTAPSSQSWYQTLEKSSLTPDGWVFAVVWPVLYACLAYIGAVLIRQRARPALKLIFISHMIFNWLWSFVFFEFHIIGAGLLLLSVLVLSGIYIFYKMQKESIRPSYLLCPYLVWLIFAAYLNAFIWLNN